MSADPDLSRFLHAQGGIYESAIEELRQGRKKSHWMWFIFPQIAGLGRSPTAQHYAIRDLGEARAYLGHPILGARLLDCCAALLAQSGKTAAEIFRYPDDLKLRSSMTLFALVSAEDSIFEQVLRQYFGGEMDPRTLALLDLSSRSSRDDFS